MMGGEPHPTILLPYQELKPRGHDHDKRRIASLAVSVLNVHVVLLHTDCSNVELRPSVVVQL